MQRPEEKSRQWLLPAIVLLGAAIRILHFAEAAPLWIDEAMLALNVGARDLLHLARPLDYAQLGPVLFLWLMKGSATLFGMSETALRLPALLAGVALIPATWYVTMRVAGPLAAAIASLLTALSPALIGYSNEAKPYGVGAIVTIALVWLAIRELDAPTLQRRTLLGVAGLLATGLSFSAPFVLLAIGGTLLFDAARTQDRRRLVEVVGWSSIWAMAFCAQYVVIHSAVGQSAYMMSYWSGIMINLGEEGWRWRTMYSVRQLLRPFVLTPGRLALWITVTILVTGALRLAGRRLLATILVVIPIVMVFVASAVGRFPIEMRLVLPLAPLVAVLLAAILAEGWLLASPYVVPRAVYPLLVCGLFGYSIYRGEAVHPVDNGRVLVHELAGLRNQEPLYVSAKGVPVWLFYSTDWRNPDTVRLAWFASVASPGGPAFSNSPPRGTRVTPPGNKLEWNDPDGLVVVGQSSGLMFTMGAPGIEYYTDAGWGEVEMSRLATAAPGSAAWVLISQNYPGEINAIRNAIPGNHGGVTREWHDFNALLLQVRFDNPDGGK